MFNAMFVAALVLVLASVLHGQGNEPVQLRGSSAKNISDSNLTSMPTSKSNDTGPITLRAKHSTMHHSKQFQYKADSRYCLSVAANVFSNGQNMQLWECSGSSGQLFVWNNGLIQVAQDPRFCVAVDWSDGKQNRDGANIQLWECDSNNILMQWSSGSGNFVVDGLVINFNEKCMAVNNNNAYNGANVHLWSCYGYEYYKGWSMGAMPVTPPTPPPTPPLLLYGKQFRFKTNPRYCLSVDANQFRNGQNMQLWECSRSSGQLFVWANGFIQVAQDPRFCVVIDGNQNLDGANIQLWECDWNNKAMQWSTSAWNLDLVANSNGKCMVVNNNHAHDGANVQLWSCYGHSEYYTRLRAWDFVF